MSNLTDGRKLTPKWYREKGEYPLRWLEALLKWVAALIVPILIALTLIYG